MNYAEIFGIEALSLNSHFSKLKVVDNQTSTGNDDISSIPDLLAQDLKAAVELLNIDEKLNCHLVAQNMSGFNLIQKNESYMLSICNSGLDSTAKKQLWLKLINAAK